MKLTNYGAGDLSDRLTILSLKLLFGEVAGKDLAHWRNERNVLLTQIRSRTLNGVWFEQVLDLAAVNAALWHAEDDLRAYRTQSLQQEMRDVVVTLAFRIQDLNDRRAALIAKINEHAGDSTAAEKL